MKKEKSYLPAFIAKYLITHAIAIIPNNNTHDQNLAKLNVQPKPVRFGSTTFGSSGL